MLIRYFVPVKEFANLGKRNRQKSLRRADNAGGAHQISVRTNRRAGPRRTSGSWGNVLREQDLRIATPLGRFPQDLITRRLSSPGRVKLSATTAANPTPGQAQVQNASDRRC